jgi:hypothetical protein
MVPLLWFQMAASKLRTIRGKPWFEQVKAPEQRRGTILLLLLDLTLHFSVAHASVG